MDIYMFLKYIKKNIYKEYVKGNIFEFKVDDTFLRYILHSNYFFIYMCIMVI